MVQGEDVEMFQGKVMENVEMKAFYSTWAVGAPNT